MSNTQINRDSSTHHRVQASGNPGGTTRTVIYVDGKAVRFKRSSDGGTPSKRGCHRRGLECRLDTTVANDKGSACHPRKPLAGRRAGGQESAGANKGKVAGADDHAVAGTRKLDRTPRHRQDFHRYAKCSGR